MNFRIDVVSYVVGSRYPGFAHGEMTHVGTRTPEPKASSTGGSTWSKYPPCSSYVMMYAELSQIGESRSATMSSSWRPIPIETSAGGCSSQPRA